MTVDELCGKYNIPRNLIQAYMELCAGRDCCGKRRLEMLDEKLKDATKKGAFKYELT